MTDKELLIVSIVGTVVFWLLTRYINKRVTGTDQEKKVKDGIKKISIIYGIAVTIQIISIISRLVDTE